MFLALPHMSQSHTRKPVMLVSGRHEKAYKNSSANPDKQVPCGGWPCASVRVCMCVCVGGGMLLTQGGRRMRLGPTQYRGCDIRLLDTPLSQSIWRFAC